MTNIQTEDLKEVLKEGINVLESYYFDLETLVEDMKNCNRISPITAQQMINIDRQIETAKKAIESSRIMFVSLKGETNV